MRNKIPVILVTGFLGSGKTTFIKETLTKHAGNCRIAVIQNEFAPSNIDGPSLRQIREPFEILEINNGSVFCICLLSDFVTSLYSFILSKQPELILIEASGLSDPIAIAEILQKKELENLVFLKDTWTIVDCMNFRKIQKMMIRVQHQLVIADHVILNKTDLVDGTDIQSLKEEIVKINPVADIFESCYCRTEGNLILSSGNHPAKAMKIDLSNKSPDTERPDIRTGVFRSGRKIKQAELLKLIKKHLPDTYRIKGYVLTNSLKTVSVQTVYDTIHIQSSEDIKSNTSLVFIGETFNLSQFSRDYRALAN